MGTDSGRFIVFEGIDASGKSTQAALLARHLEQQGRRVHLTAEPTTGPIGTLIRLAFSGRVPLDDRVIASLFAADRLDHLTNERDGVLALLEDGVDVVSDRYHLSSLAYHASDVGFDWVLATNEISTNLRRPDITLYLDLPPEAALARLANRRESADKFEEIGRLTAAYRDYAHAIEVLGADDNIHRVPADGDATATFEAVLAAFEHLPRP